MKMEGESVLLKTNLTQWRFCLYPKYVLLPIDENRDEVKSNVKNVVYSEVSPRPLERPARLVGSSGAALAGALDLEPGVARTQEFVDFVAGRRLPPGALPVAHRYGGHQYGLWVGQLGDGRALLLGEYVSRRGERWQLQLKGAGRTPYSRAFDGRAVLRAGVRELLASEAMFHLGVPTTRTAALVASDDVVVRDVFYSGAARRERACVLLRVARSWFRFGSLELLARGGDLPVLKQLTDFVIKEHFSEISLTDENRLIRLFSEIAHRSLDLVAKWQGLGFAHGLLNTDNMSLLGVTLHYGPFAFVDSYDGGFVANCCDAEGRYALAKQPDVRHCSLPDATANRRAELTVSASEARELFCFTEERESPPRGLALEPLATWQVVLWNLAQLGAALQPLLAAPQRAQLAHVLKTLDAYVKNKILETFLLKIGLKKERWGDEELVEKLLDMMQSTGADFTATFRQLAELEPFEMVSESKLAEQWALRRLAAHASWGCWLEQYRERLDKEPDEECGAEGARRALPEAERRRRMRAASPAYVPRSALLHRAALAAERDDFEEVRFLLRVLQSPYEVQAEAEARGLSAPPPTWALGLKISCSS